MLFFSCTHVHTFRVSQPSLFCPFNRATSSRAPATVVIPQGASYYPGKRLGVIDGIQGKEPALCCSFGIIEAPVQYQ